MTIADVIDEILNLRISQIADYVGDVLTNVWVWAIVITITAMYMVTEIRTQRNHHNDAKQADRLRDELIKVNRESRGG